MEQIAHKKIIHVSRLYFPHIGGIETHLGKLNRELITRNYEIIVITEKFEKRLLKLELIDGITILRVNIRSHGWIYKLSIWFGFCYKLSLLLSADIIQIHDVFWWLVPFFPLFFFKKIYITFHGYEGSEAPTRKQIFWHRLAAILTRGNICVGDFHKNWYGVKPTFVTYGAVEAGTKNNKLTSANLAASVTTDSLKAQKSKSQNKQQKIIFVGRLEDDNGIRDYLQALLLLKQQKQIYHLDAYGDGPLLAVCQKFVKKNQLSVTFHGFVDQSTIPYQQYYLAFVSRYLSILEALALGLPVIAHYNNAIKYDYLAMAPFAKWITMASRPQEIAKAVLGQSSLPKAATTWARQQTWSKLADIYEQLWDK